MTERPWYLPAVVAVGVLALATASILIKKCDDAPPLIIAASRMTLSAVLLWPLLLGRRVTEESRLDRGQTWLMLLAGGFLAAHFFFWITSLKHTSVLSSVVIVTTNPIFVSIASFFLLGERVRPVVFAAIGIAMAGGGLIAWSDAGHAGSNLYGDLMSLCGAVMASSYWLACRVARRTVSASRFMIVVYTTAAVLLVAAALLSGHDFGGYRTSTYVYFVMLAVVPQLLGHGSLNWALRHVTATAVALCILGEPVGSTILAYLLLGEHVSATQAVGGMLILAAVVIAVRFGDRKA